MTVNAYLCWWSHLGSNQGPTDYETIEADWIISLDKGGYSGKVLDLSDNSKVIAKFDSEKFGMVFQAYRDSKRSDEFKTFVKVIMNELLKSVK